MKFSSTFGLRSTNTEKMSTTNKGTKTPSMTAENSRSGSPQIVSARAKEHKSHDPVLVVEPTPSVTGDAAVAESPPPAVWACLPCLRQRVDVVAAAAAAEITARFCADPSIVVPSRAVLEAKLTELIAGGAKNVRAGLLTHLRITESSIARACLAPNHITTWSACNGTSA